MAYSADASVAKPLAGRVLTVDDSLVIQLVMAAALEAEGYEVVSVESGEQALAAVQGHPAFDVVILDVTLEGGMDGTEVGHALRADPKTRCSMIAMHTTEREETVKAAFAAYDAFLPKPCDLGLLSETMARLVRDHRSNEVAATVD